MNHRGAHYAFVIIATASLLIGFSAKPTQAVQTQVSRVAPPLTAAPTAMIQTETVDPKRKREVECLARNMYFEARGESTAGQLAVGQVTINRTKAEHYPNSICGVVGQRSQFSWRWDGKADVITQPKIYSQIETMAEFLYDDYYVSSKFPDLVDGATHFHTASVNPQWKGKTLIVRIGNHNFYKVRG
jgi:spore germination cell wall hydrolase CwlJ-like protein